MKAKRFYVDHGLTGRSRDRPACRAGDPLVVTKLDWLARPLPNARDIVAELTGRRGEAQCRRVGPRPERVAVVKAAQKVVAKAKIIAAHLIDPIGRLLFSVLVMIAEFESDLIRLRTGGPEGRQSRWAAPRVGTEAQRLPGRHTWSGVYRAGEHTTAVLAQLFSVGRSTVYRAVPRAGGVG